MKVKSNIIKVTIFYAGESIQWNSMSFCVIYINVICIKSEGERFGEYVIFQYFLLFLFFSSLTVKYLGVIFFVLILLDS